jgi:competence protein ComEA
VAHATDNVVPPQGIPAAVVHSRPDCPQQKADRPATTTAGHNVDCVIDTTSRRDRRSARAHSRLDELISQAAPDRTAATLPADHSWLDASRDARPSGAPDPEWWPDTGSPPPDVGAGPPGPTPEPHPREPDRVLLGGPPPAAAPWWRRRLDQLLQRWLPAPAPASERRWRLAAAAAAGAVLLGVAVAVGLVMSGSGGEPEVPPALPVAPVGEARPPSATSPGPDGGSIVVSVVGRVARPGLITLRDGARVADALEATGGAARGALLGGLNLARRLSDGEQVYVGVPAPPNVEQPSAASASGTTGNGPVDLNSASITALDTLPGVGPVTAQRILDWRTQHGRFASVDQLREIDGIGPSRFAKLKDLVVAR